MENAFCMKPTFQFGIAAGKGVQPKALNFGRGHNDVRLADEKLLIE